MFSLNKFSVTGIALALLLTVAGNFYFLKTDDAVLESPKPCIEVIGGLVVERNPFTHEILRELKTGDEPAVQNIIEAQKSGSAVIHFPDGSVARLDSESSVQVTDALFNHGTGQLVVKINLLAGRVWSKIVSLATPDSAWEVKTTNAVATVRGTAFGMEFSNGKSTVIVSEHKVSVTALDPETREPMKDAMVFVEEGKLVSLNNNDVAVMKSLQSSEPAIRETVVKDMELMKVEAVPAELLDQEWIKTNMETGSIIESKVQESEESGKDSGQELPSVMKSELQPIIQTEVSLKNPEIESEVKDSDVNAVDSVDTAAATVTSITNVTNTTQNTLISDETNSTPVTTTTDTTQSTLISVEADSTSIPATTDITENTLTSNETSSVSTAIPLDTTINSLPQ